ncbi:MAG: hypothetical protein V1659_03220 [Candidatus Woesearchaeota archaeon]
MGEIDKIVKDKTVSYEGLLDIKGLFHSIDSWFAINGYDNLDTHSEEKLLETGKKLLVKKKPSKKLSDYAKSNFEVNVLVTDMKDVEVEHQGVKKKLWHGKANIQINAFLETDYKGSLDNKPFYLFFRVLADAFVHKSYVNQWKKKILNDAEALLKEIKSFLNITMK